MEASLRYRVAKVWLAGHRALRWAAKPYAPAAFRIVHFHDIPSQQIKGFERLLHYIVKNHGVLTPEQAETLLLKRGQEATNKRVPYLLTFDDGFKSNLLVAEQILSRYNVKAIFFVCPGLLDLPRDTQRGVIVRNMEVRVSDSNHLDELALMSWDDLKKLIEMGHIIGSHGLQHLRLSELPEVDLEKEIKKSADLLEERLGVIVNWFAYPFGDVNSVHHPAMKVIAGRYRFCRSGVRGANVLTNSPLTLMTEEINLDAPFPYQQLAVEGGLDIFYNSARKRLRATLDNRAL